MKVAVSVIVATKNEEKKLKACLDCLRDFDQVVVVDSQSQDRTVAVAKAAEAETTEFVWNRQYPKKRQWCLDYLALKHDWVFFVDADERVTPELAREIGALFAGGPEACGYFIKARFLTGGRLLRFGLQNSKLALFDRRKVEFPLVNDLDIPGMGEMEGHYQPVLKPAFKGEKIGRLKYFIVHDALDDERGWIFRHQKYARWETGMNAKDAWPDDPKPFRNRVKKLLRRSAYRPELIFFISYILLGGFLDGNNGLKFAKKKKEYYALIK